MTENEVPPICFEANLAAVFFNLASSCKLAPKHYYLS